MLALLATGGSLIHFIDAPWALGAGVVLLIAGPLLFAVGVGRFRRVNEHPRCVRPPS